MQAVRWALDRRCLLPASREVAVVADLGFVVLTVASFAVLVLALRGSERL
jgi:hypothetical protein